MKKVIIAVLIIAIILIGLVAIGKNCVDYAVAGYCIANDCDFIGFTQPDNGRISFAVSDCSGCIDIVSMPTEAIPELAEMTYDYVHQN